VRCPCQHVDAAQRTLKQAAREAIERERVQSPRIIGADQSLSDVGRDEVVLVSPSYVEPAHPGESNEE